LAQNRQPAVNNKQTECYDNEFHLDFRSRQSLRRSTQYQVPLYPIPRSLLPRRVDNIAICVEPMSGTRHFAAAQGLSQ